VTARSLAERSRTVAILRDDDITNWRIFVSNTLTTSHDPKELVIDAYNGKLLHG
jgi:hypothetical protein